LNNPTIKSAQRKFNINITAKAATVKMVAAFSIPKNKSSTTEKNIISNQKPERSI